MSEQKEKKLKPEVLEERMFKLRHNLEQTEDAYAELKKTQESIDENFEIAQSQLRQLDYYQLSHEESMKLSTVMQRQNHLRQLIRDRNDKRLKEYQNSKESNEKELASVKKTYYNLLDNQSDEKKDNQV
ncbi:hypothetical protein DDV21_010090 [Streptococcus chenjunshii]|uniref:Uncharacterized protein n=2 Tax=Streptococcus chenjunshii TaxID=2173853 RepID=A0A372KIV9_9STRE|nr:hypothetical protein [Streptococcus chenjunshii]AXQ79400.1 hypothetical protein DDV21_010090 [Streptococcus chenjunshii]RFU50013.1 hypothetical protein DDV22_10865 [Streptococcus chenjunshii]RFU52197.1 hypothetical protein DDV23_10990 [Streptococcus chenjunshii]